MNIRKHQKLQCTEGGTLSGEKIAIRGNVSIGKSEHGYFVTSATWLTKEYTCSYGQIKGNCKSGQSRPEKTI
jgi:ABC-type transport system involved in cytochrome bd biosynthesis fused ATPase/permease subunit